MPLLYARDRYREVEIPLLQGGEGQVLVASKVMNAANGPVVKTCPLFVHASRAWEMISKA